VTEIAHIGVVGGGAWGTALACLGRRAGRRVTLWSRDRRVSAAIAHDRRNEIYLPGQSLDAGIEAATELAELAGCDAILLVCPAQALRTVAHGLPGSGPVVICAKGIEAATGLLMPEVLAEVLPGRAIAMLSGPSFAEEAVQGLPTAVSIATADAALGRDLAASLAAGMFRPYWTDDVVGVSIGGAVKNVLAIATGILDGMAALAPGAEGSPGLNARAALITRGLAEMTRLGIALGARPETFMGLSGLGDLVLTATGDLSRNRRVGVLLAAGRTLPDVLAELGHVAEGVYSAATVLARARALGVEMPITEAVVDVLEGRTAPARALVALMSRQSKAEA